MEEMVVQVPFKIDQDWVDSVMSSCIDGGMTSYWCSSCDRKEGEKVEAEYRSEVISRGGTLIFELDEPFDDDDTEIYELTLDKLLVGFRKYIEWSLEVGRTFYVRPEDIDSVEADCIVQLALFGEVIYG